MAVTRLLRIKETPGSNPAAHLKKNLFYICRPDKTADGLYIGGNAGVSPEIIYDTMKQNKRLWGKESNLAGNCTQGLPGRTGILRRAFRGAVLLCICRPQRPIPHPYAYYI